VLDTDVEAFNRAVREADLPAVLTEAEAAGRWTEPHHGGV
jgi:hypothetical protein